MTTVDSQGDIVIVHVAGDRLDAAASGAFKKAVTDGVRPEAVKVLLDLGAVEFVDSTGLGAIVAIMKRLPSDGALVIIGARQPVRRLLQITGLDRLFRQFSTVEEALAELGR